MNFHAVICTRDRNSVTETTDKLINFLCSCGIGVYLLSGAKSIFKGYTGAFEKIDPQDDDIMIFCHDDIEIRDTPQQFLDKLTQALELPETGGELVGRDSWHKNREAFIANNTLPLEIKA
jgi:hypothetical protein